MYFHYLAEKLKREHLEKHELGWIEWPGAMDVFRIAKARVFDEKGNKIIENVPKWDCFKMIIDEIKQKVAKKQEFPGL